MLTILRRRRGLPRDPAQHPPAAERRGGVEHRSVRAERLTEVAAPATEVRLVQHEQRRAVLPRQVTDVQAAQGEHAAHPPARHAARPPGRARSGPLAAPGDARPAARQRGAGLAWATRLMALALLMASAPGDRRASRYPRLAAAPCHSRSGAPTPSRPSPAGAPSAPPRPATAGRQRPGRRPVPPATGRSRPAPPCPAAPPGRSPGSRSTPGPGPPGNGSGCPAARAAPPRLPVRQPGQFAEQRLLAGVREQARRNSAASPEAEVSGLAQVEAACACAYWTA